MAVRPITLRMRRIERTRAEPRRATTKQRGYDADWKRLRADHLKREPLCRPCLATHMRPPGAVVDHIKDIATHPRLRLVDENLQSMCAPCHNRKTHYTQRGRARQ